jgi:peptidoglycan/xylan/chitin deacetylase (PgdA/CDA1 family)
MYHSVSEKATREWGPWRHAISPATFEQQIAWLSEHKSLVAFEDVVAYLRGDKTLPENAVALTFDDGYKDFLNCALPILRRYDAPSTLYVSTALMKEGAAPYEFRLGETLQQKEKITIKINDREITYRPITNERVKKAYQELRQIIEKFPPEQREDFMKKNEFVRCSEFEILSSELVNELATEQLVTIGSHGHIHRPLGIAPQEEMRQNIQKSRTELKALLGSPPDNFSFPYGSSSQRARHVVKAAGFKSAVTTDTRLVLPRDWNRCYSIPRINMAIEECIPRQIHGCM